MSARTRLAAKLQSRTPKSVCNVAIERASDRPSGASKLIVVRIHMPSGANGSSWKRPEELTWQFSLRRVRAQLSSKIWFRALLPASSGKRADVVYNEVGMDKRVFSKDTLTVRDINPPTMTGSRFTRTN